MVEYITDVLNKWPSHGHALDTSLAPVPSCFVLSLDCSVVQFDLKALLHFLLVL